MRKTKCQAWRSHIQHDRCLQCWQVLQIGYSLFKWDGPFIYDSVIALSTGRSDQLPVTQDFGGIPTTHNSRYTQFPCNNRGVTSAPALVSNDRWGFFHNGFPIRIGHIGYQYIARLKFVAFGDAFIQWIQNRNITCRNLVTDSNTFKQRRSRRGFIHQVARDLSVVLLWMDRFRPCLNNKKLLAQSVDCPFHIHRAPSVFYCRIILFYLNHPFGQLKYPFIC